MSCIKRTIEELIYSMGYDEFYSLMKSSGWDDEEIDEMYGLYRG